jgi:asparagine synthase (glutamine-hydrolysing)
MKAFTGRFTEDERYDESPYARAVADERDLDLRVIDIGVGDFLGSIERVIYQLDYPTAGPGSFPQYMVSEAAARESKVILGGQGGDEVFGGYARYLIAYFEQCIKAAIDGTMTSGHFVVTYESIIPNLVALQNYKPLLKEFWRDGMFEGLDQRYFRLINRAPDLGESVDFDSLGEYSPFETFQKIFNGGNVGHESYFDKMTHFDFKTLLPALLQVEDRVSMAHGLESRVPLLDHELVELAATIPADVKFKNGTMKHVFKEATRSLVPEAIERRKDKMGFPVPLHEWFAGPARDFITDAFATSEALSREYFDNRKVLAGLEKENRFGRQTWGLLSLELWQRQFHDRESEFKKLLTTRGTPSEGSDHGGSRVHRLAPGRSAVG